MINNYTPGPWRYTPHKPQEQLSGFLILKDTTINAPNIATTIPCIGMTKAEVEANAKLISAAPEMHHCIDMFYRYFEEPLNSPESLDEIRKNVNSIIKKLKK